MNIIEIKSREISQMAGQRIGRLRESAGLSRSALAQLTGCDEAYLEDIEACRTDPSIRTLDDIARVFEVDLLFLVAGVSARSKGGCS